MKPTKRHPDPLGRSRTLSGYRRYALCLAIAITGSAWPIQARSIEAIFDSRDPFAEVLAAEPPVSEPALARGTRPQPSRCDLDGAAQVITGARRP